MNHAGQNAADCKRQDLVTRVGQWLFSDCIKPADPDVERQVVDLPQVENPVMLGEPDREPANQLGAEPPEAAFPISPLISIAASMSGWTCVAG